MSDPKSQMILHYNAEVRQPMDRTDPVQVSSPKLPRGWTAEVHRTNSRYYAGVWLRTPEDISQGGDFSGVSVEEFDEHIALLVGKARQRIVQADAIEEVVATRRVIPSD